MANSVFSLFSDDQFMDLTLYQYGYEQCAPLHSYGPYVRNHHLFHYILSGKGTLVCNDGPDHQSTYHLSAGQGFLIEPGVVNTYYADRLDPWEYTWVEFSGLRISQYMQMAGLSSQSPIFTPSSPDYGESLRNELLYIANHKSASPLNIIGHLYLALDLLISGSSNRRRLQGGSLQKFYVHEAIVFIEQNYMNPITVEDLSRQCKLDRSYFGKIFRKQLGQSPQEFLISFRMARAAELLAATTISIGEVSQQVGYANQLHFSRAFKKVYGMSPRDYRQKHRIL